MLPELSYVGPRNRDIILSEVGGVGPNGRVYGKDKGIYMMSLDYIMLTRRMCEGKMKQKKIIINVKYFVL